VLFYCSIPCKHPQPAEKKYGKYEVFEFYFSFFSDFSSVHCLGIVTNHERLLSGVENTGS